MDRRSFFKNVGAVGIATAVAPTILMDIINSEGEDNKKQLHYVIDATISGSVFRCKKPHNLFHNDLILCTDMVMEERLVVERIIDDKTFWAKCFRKEMTMEGDVQIMSMSSVFSKGNHGT